MIYWNPNVTAYNNAGYSRVSNRSYNLLKNYGTSYGYGSYGINSFDSIYNNLMQKAVNAVHKTDTTGSTTTEDAGKDAQSAAMFAAALTKSMQLMALQAGGMTGYGMNSGIYNAYNNCNYFSGLYNWKL